VRVMRGQLAGMLVETFGESTGGHGRAISGNG
jgi:hypothetical protein